MTPPASMATRLITEGEALKRLAKAAAAETQRGIAKQLGISAGHLNHAIHGRRDPEQVLRRFGYMRIVLYRKIKS